MRYLILVLVLAGCGTVYPLQVIDDTSDMMVIRATGKTEYEAMNAATAKAEKEIGRYTPAREPDCNFSTGGQEWSGTGSWHECVVYAAK